MQRRGCFVPGGRVLLELGCDQARQLAPILTDVGLAEILVHRDADGQTA